MKRVFLIASILLLTGIAAYAQQAAGQTRQDAQQFLSQSRSKLSEFESSLSTLKERNGSTEGSYTIMRLRTEIERLENVISSEERAITASLDRGNRVSSQVMDRMENSINQYRDRLDDLEAALR